MQVNALTLNILIEFNPNKTTYKWHSSNARTTKAITPR